MTTKPIETLDQAVRDTASQSQHLTQMIAQCLLYNTPESNRRSLTPAGFWIEQRRGERRTPERATAGRRQLSDRRLPPEERISEWRLQLAQVLDRSIELCNLKRRLQLRSKILSPKG